MVLRAFCSTQLWTGCILRASNAPIGNRCQAAFARHAPRPATTESAAFMAQRKLLQYGWISGPVECRCSECEWSSTFQAVDVTVPSNVLSDFEQHSCNQQEASPQPAPRGRKRADVGLGP